MQMGRTDQGIAGSTDQTQDRDNQNPASTSLLLMLPFVTVPVYTYDFIGLPILHG